jgi:hypothetical protein
MMKLIVASRNLMNAPEKHSTFHTRSVFMLRFMLRINMSSFPERHKLSDIECSDFLKVTWLNTPPENDTGMPKHVAVAIL